ncbi:hypothetical protein ABZ725_14020 [Streptomyces sp. NPDC006872]|uniref:hypothetical protein n=1 Tax=Streptomyces sp. NPDC006872 TaxID=3155720 RepID=UPI0034051D44
MTRPWSSMDVPLAVVEADIAAAHFEQAAGRTKSPSDQIAFRLDAWLVKHPDDVRAAAAAYPDWPAQFAAIKAAHSSTTAGEADRV